VLMGKLDADTLRLLLRLCRNFFLNGFSFI
jgi:hypothetical protein